MYEHILKDVLSLSQTENMLPWNLISQGILPRGFNVYMKPTLQMELSSEVKDSSQILKAVAGVSWKSSRLLLSYNDLTS